MTRSIMLIAALLLFASVAQADADDEVSFKNDVQPIFNSRCAFCHIDGAENGGLNLGRHKSYAALVSTPSTESPLQRVAPGAPDKSYLIHKLRGTQGKVGGSGNAMPMVDPPRPFDPELLKLITRWVKQGALDN